MTRHALTRQNYRLLKYLDEWEVWMKVRDIIKLVEEDGWDLVMIKGSYRQYKHPTRTGRVTIAGHLSKEVPPGTLSSIFKQAQLPRRI